MPLGPKADVKLANGLTKNASGRKAELFIVADRRANGGEVVETQWPSLLRLFDYELFFVSVALFTTLKYGGFLPY